MTIHQPIAEPETSDAEKRRRREHVPGFHLDCGAGPDVPHVGIVFVHGIGSQEAGATLLDWGGKITALLLDARAIEGAAGDPVIDCQLDPGPSESRYIELQLPEATNKNHELVPEQHWVMTEAWWAQRVRPPAFGEMAEWLGPRGAIRRIVAAMLPRGGGEHDPRLRPSVTVHRLTWRAIARRPIWDILGRRTRKTEPMVEEDAETGSVYGTPRSTGVVGLDRLASIVKNVGSDIGTLLAKVGVGLYFQAISALLLVLYGALRSVEKVVPIGPLKNGALTRPIDTFVLDWFGDVYVLLGDPAQAASVRGRLIDALNDLHGNNCSSVAIVAHSGGAIVSYMTLADPAQKGIRVDRLITLGEGLNLAWRLTAGDDGNVDDDTRNRYNRLYRDVFEGRDGLVWHDFWSSQDPAPVGVLKPPDDRTIGKTSLGRIRTHAVWNRLAFREDHGTYWDNDEEFLIPLARLLVANPSGARMFPDTDKDQMYSNRRRRRLSFLSIWRQLAIVAPTTAIVTAFALRVDSAARAGASVAHAWSGLPGSEVISGPVTALRNLNLQDSVIGNFLAETGVWVVAAILCLLTVVSLLPPPERPVPWYDKDKPWWRPFNLFARFLRFVPWVVALPVLVVVFGAWTRLSTGATDAGSRAGEVALVVFVVTLLIAIVGSVIAGSPKKEPRKAAWLRDGVEMAVTIGVMAVVAVLAVAPIVAIVSFEEVGTIVLGIATVIVAFQIIGRIGVWRWNVWDGRERVAARLQKDKYPPLLRIFVQMTVLLATVGLAFAAVVQGSTDLAGMALIGVAIAVLLGVAVDVFDAARQERRNPLDAMRHSVSSAAHVSSQF